MRASCGKSPALRCPEARPGHRPGPFFASERGFTLTELIVTIIVAGILAATVIPRFSGQHGFEERGFRDQTVAALRYAQKAAIALRRPVCAAFTANSLSFTVGTAPVAAPVNCGAGVVPPLLGPNGVAYVLNAPTGVTYTTFPATLVFSARGSMASASVTTTDSVSVSGLPASLDITVEKETGYVR